MVINQINIKPILNKTSFKSASKNNTEVDKHVLQDYFISINEPSVPKPPVEQFREALRGWASLTDEQITEINATKIAPENMSFVPEQILKPSWNRFIPPLWVNTGNYLIMNNGAIKLSSNKALDQMKTNILPQGFKVEKNSAGHVKVIKVNQTQL